MATPPPEMPSWQQRSGQSHASTNYNKNQRGGGGGGGNFFLHPVMFCFSLGIVHKLRLQDEVGRWSKNVHFLSTFIP